MKRVPQVEVMDDPALEEARHAAALAGLARINRVSRSVQMMMPGIREAAALQREGANPNLRILDLACGAGDVAVGIWRQARREGINAEIEGCDFSDVAVRHAAARARTAMGGEDHRRDADAAGNATLRFVRRDVLREELPAGFDVVMCSLFVHHLSPADAVVVLRKMALAAQRMVLINDLSRSRSGLALVYLATRVLSRSEVVHVDGPRSVRQAYTLDEARAMGHAAGMETCTVQARFPCRWLMTWRRG